MYTHSTDKIAKLQTDIREILKFPQNLASLPRNGEGVKQAIQKLEKEKEITQHQQDLNNSSARLKQFDIILETSNT